MTTPLPALGGGPAPIRHRASHFHVRRVDGVPLTATQAAVLAFARTLPADAPPLRYTDAAQQLGSGIDRRTIRSCAARLRQLGFAEAGRLGAAGPPPPAWLRPDRARTDDGVTVHPDPPEEVVAEVRRRRDAVRHRAELEVRKGGHPRAGVVELPARVHRVTPETVSRRGRATA